MLKRARKDFRYAMVMGLGVTALAGILPLTLLRFSRGQWLLGTIDVGIMLSIAGCMVAMQRGATTLRIVQAAVAICSVGAAVVAWLDPANGVHWVYAVIVANFLLAPHVYAAIVSLLMVAVTAVSVARTDLGMPLIAFVTTALMVTGFAFVFAFRSERQRRQLEDLALQDPLTGLGNRRALTWRMDALVQQAQQRGKPLGLILFDLDHFKRINDSYGHARGDDVLREVAVIVRTSVRSIDELYRMGGEEFVLLLPGTDHATLQARAHELQAVLRQKLRCEGHPVTASMGAVSWRSDEDPAAWLARADALMYAAKGSGRDALHVEAL